MHPKYCAYRITRIPPKPVLASLYDAMLRFCGVLDLKVYKLQPGA